MELLPNPAKLISDFQHDFDSVASFSQTSLVERGRLGVHVLTLYNVQCVSLKSRTLTQGLSIRALIDNYLALMTQNIPSIFLAFLVFGRNQMQKSCSV